MEIWIPIIDFEDYYEVSNLGNVRNRLTGKILVGDINSTGYRRVILYYNGQKKRYFVHKLVAIHFCDGYSEELIVNHIDGNKLNNESTNLEWVTRSENDIHAFNNNLRDIVNRKRVAKIHKVTNEILDVYDSIEDAMLQNGITSNNISSVCKGIRKTANGFKWRYV